MAFQSDKSFKRDAWTTLGVTTITLKAKQRQPLHDTSALGPLHDTIDPNLVVQYLRENLAWHPYIDEVKDYTVDGGGKLFPTPTSFDAVHNGSKHVLSQQCASVYGFGVGQSLTFFLVYSAICCKCKCCGRRCCGRRRCSRR